MFNTSIIRQFQLKAPIINAGGLGMLAGVIIARMMKEAEEVLARRAQAA